MFENLSHRRSKILLSFLYRPKLKIQSLNRKYIHLSWTTTIKIFSHPFGVLTSKFVYNNWSFLFSDIKYNLLCSLQIQLILLQNYSTSPAATISHNVPKKHHLTTTAWTLEHQSSKTSHTTLKIITRLYNQENTLTKFSTLKKSTSTLYSTLNLVEPYYNISTLKPNCNFLRIFVLKFCVFETHL